MKQEMKWLAVLLCLAMAFSFAACSADEPAATDPGTTDTGAVEPSSPALDYPTRSIKASIGYGAGGTTDSALRPLFSIAEKLMGQSIVVENLSGGSASISFQSVIDAPADGYTLLGGAEAPALYDAYDLIDYTYEDVTMIMIAASADQHIFVAADSPYDSVEELFNQELSEPGSVLKVASGAVGVNATLDSIWKNTLNLSFDVYTSDSGATSVTTVLGGFADFGLGSTATLNDFYKNGDIKILCTNATERDPAFPDVPAITEFYPDMAEYLPIPAFYSVAVHKDTPQEIVDYLIEIFQEAYNSAEYQEALGVQMINPEGLFGADADEFVAGFRYRAVASLTAAGVVNYTMEELGLE